MNKLDSFHTRSIKITDPGGLHMRPAAEIVAICKKGKSNVQISCGGCPEADGCSILSLLTLAAQYGQSITVKAQGDDAKDVIEKISNIFTDGAGI
jgi:phosphocarrier protein